MKRFLLFLFIVISYAARSQAYNNEWIDYSKTYYKFKVGQTGLYRISQATLSSIGLSTTSADQFQLWRNGKQVPIYTTVPAGPLGASDYIEFWGEMNDGKPDNILYLNPDYQLCDKWSIESDTAAFFLTVNPSGGNARFNSTVNTITGTLSPEPYFMYTAGNYFRQKVNPGYAASVGEYVYSSSYDKGEGWTSNDIAAGSDPTSASPFTVASFNNLYWYSSGPAPRLRLAAAGDAINPRTFRIRVNGDSLVGRQMDYFDYAKIDTTFNGGLLGAGFVIVDVTNQSAISTDRMVVAKCEIVYPRQFNFGGLNNFVFTLPANAAGNYLQITNFNYGSTAPVLYDITNGTRYVADISTPSTVKIQLQPSAVERTLVLVSEDASNITAINSLQTRNFIDYSTTANKGNYLIISNSALLSASDGSNPVEDYRAYRSSAAGGSYNSKIYLIDQLVDQFGLGIRSHPLSIRNFARFARNNFGFPIKDIFLIGKGINYSQYLYYHMIGGYESYINQLDFVPTFGQPASDNLLTTEGASAIPLTPIGRLSVISGDEAEAYLQKVREYELAQATPSCNIDDKAWMKNVVHVVGASDDNLDQILGNYMDHYSQIISDTLFGANVITFRKSSADNVQQLSNQQLHDLFTQGISLLTYFGHSSSSTLEFNLDNPENYENQGKYPVFIVMGCNAGSFFNLNPQRLAIKETLSEKFVLAPERGSIAFLASTHFGIVHYLDIYNNKNYTA
ncbi:MAG: hypothetical protein JSU05_06765, partial [Bacteroidetes bacterium]|nr:hypothetical protein [Bacteroidota bacterium]